MSSPNIPGADALVAWFGRWPSFHDAEILSIHLNRGGRSVMRIHAWNTSNSVDEKGFFVRDREAIVVFEFEEIRSLSLNGENRQNVIAGLTVEPTEDGHRVELSPCYGIAGEVVAKHVSVRVEPGA